MKTLVVGLGNPLLGDDAVGWRVAEEVQRRLRSADWRFESGDWASQAAISNLKSQIPNPQSTIEVECFALGGLSLMERMVGYDRAIVVDAVMFGAPPGTVTCFDLADLPDRSAAHLTAAHDTSLQNALRFGRSMGAQLPNEVKVVGVEAEQLFEFSEHLTPAVAAAVPEATRRVLDLLNQKA
ncbi:MAG: hydrogenase maturation protease [Anaerolineales bacterium]|nr:hydrogenase maturation protease [Anaerolineales bacterium]